MRKFQFAVIIILLISTFSCTDKFINDLDIEVPDEEQLLVINLELTEGDSCAKTFVAQTANLDVVEHTFFEDATVDLFKEGEFLKTLEYNQEGNEYTADFDSDILSAGEYSVEVSGVSGFNDIRATQRIPDKVNILEGSYQEDGTIETDYGYAYTVDEARIKFVDPADEVNFYQVELYLVIENKITEELRKYDLFVSSINPFAENSYYYDGILMKDDSFNGTELDLSIGFSNYFYGSSNDEEEIYLLAKLSNISRDNYLYLRSEAGFQESIDNPFSEPVIVHNNIENGIGIFRTRNTSELRIDF